MMMRNPLIGEICKVKGSPYYCKIYNIRKDKLIEVLMSIDMKFTFCLKKVFKRSDLTRI